MPISRRYYPEHPAGDKAAFGMDFSYVLPRGTGIASGALSIYTNAATPAVSTDFTIGPVSIEDRTLYADLSGGVDGRDYQLRWQATDTDGYIWTRTGLILCAVTS